MTIGREIRGGQARVGTLVPDSRKYFDRLVGASDGSVSVGQYAVGGGGAHLSALAEWGAPQYLIYSLYLSSHSLLTERIAAGQLETEGLARALEFLEKYGDRMSQVGAIEVGLRVLPERPEIAPLLVALVERIRYDDIGGRGSGIVLFSSLFHFVDAELSRNRLFAKEPPYYRRLAALAQAAMICGQINSMHMDGESISKWAFSRSLWQCELQSFVDMRSEPRWDYRLAAPSQLKSQFVGRVVIASRRFEAALTNHGRLANIVRELPECLEGGGTNQSYRMFLRGPLDGREDPLEELPANIARSIEEQLCTEEVRLRSFVPFVNAALFYRVKPQVVTLAAEALGRLEYGSSGVESASELFSLVRGLATAAAVCRSSRIAEEVRVLVRRYRRDSEPPIAAEDALEILLVAAASRADAEEWGRWVGGVFAGMALGELGEEEGKLGYFAVRRLCDIRPELWAHCGSAEAALAAWHGKLQDAVLKQRDVT